MKIAISGSTGFLGRALLSRLDSSGFNILGIKRFSNPLNLNSTLNGDNSRLVANEFELFNFFQMNGDIKVVIHAATNYGRDNSELFNSTTSVFWSNVEFPMKLMEEAIRIKCNLFINIDSFFSSEYSEYQYLANYSLSKKHFREWGSLCANEQLIRFVNIRLFHLYGPGDSLSKFVPIIINRCLSNEDIDLTDGLQKRDFIYIDDAVNAIDSIIKSECGKPKGYASYDLGTGQTQSIRKLVEDVKKICASSSKLNFGSLPKRIGEFADSCANIEPLSRLGWSACTNLDKGLKSTIDYIKKNKL